MYQTISIERESPPFGEFVTTIDKNGEHMVHRMNKDGTWTMRDSDGTNSPNNNLEITHWLKKCMRDDFTRIAIEYQGIENLRDKKQKLYGLRQQVIDILQGHYEIPEEEILKLFNQLEGLSKYLNDSINKIYKRVGV